MSEIMRHFPWPSEITNKHTRGRLLVFSGDYLNTGAARLAANAGARVGAGWVKILAPPKACEIIAAHETSLLIGEYEKGSRLSNDLGEYHAAVIGMGFGKDIAGMATIDRLMETDLALVFDADALGIIKNEKDFFARIKARSAPVVFTPHEGEFIKLFDCQKSHDLRQKAFITQEAAKLSGARIIHKGAITVVATPKGEILYSEDAPPTLATMGTGDVLAGIVAGLLAQRLSPVRACQMAVFIHNMAAWECGQGMIAQDLLGAIPRVLNQFSEPPEVEIDDQLPF